MQLYYYHFDKCAGTSVQHFLRTSIAENEFIYLERYDYPVDERQCFDKKLLHDPGANDHAQLPWRPLKFAIFRHPLERAFSHYKMTTRWNEELTTDLLRQIHQASLYGVTKFFSAKRELLGSHFNVIARTLVGKSLWEDWFRETSVTSPDLTCAPTENLLRIALEELKSVDLILDMNDLSLASPLANAVANSDFGLTFNSTLNTYNTKNEFRGLTNEDLNSIKRFNELDLILWNEVCRRIALARAPAIIRAYSNANDTQILDFSRGIPADNIWPRETNDLKNSIWTSNNGDTTFYFRKKSRTRKHFCMLITAVLSPYQFEKLRISLNGNIIPWRHLDTNRGFLVVATIERDILPPGSILPIRISTPVVAPTNPADKRLLGLELSAASLIADWDPSFAL
ncbi:MULTISPECIES: hypothetical protein [Rhizobium]|uniref:Sulfotransferase family protein n=1 Tax=Rhizobium paranaense TaxID=1650438 RepID=A0A7W8XYE0_9HYPH|nr:hypothetical protein [Rhizobium paranaense]MBB5577644.1 hypothetical protein [Rhizobium paranaense]